jgi:Nitrogen Permease regulator of amino acid transport activity 3
MHRLPLASYSASFASEFPHLPPLPVMLSRLAEPRTFSSVIPSTVSRSQQPLYLDALIWLLKADLVIQMHVFVRVIARPTIKHAAKDAWLSKTGAFLPGLKRGSSIAGSEELELEEDNETEESAVSVTTAPSGALLFPGLDIPRRRNSLGVTTLATTATGATTAAMTMASVSPTMTPSMLSKKLSSSASALVPFQTALSSRARGGLNGIGASLYLGSAATGTGDSFSTSTSTRADSTDHDEGAVADEFPDQDTIVTEPGQPTPIQERWLAQMTVDKDPKVVERFEKWVCIASPNG